MHTFHYLYICTFTYLYIAGQCLAAEVDTQLLSYTLRGGETLSTGFAARAYYSNDQRIQWSGGECTFGTEAAITPQFVCRTGSSQIKLFGEFFLQQPYEKNVYFPAGDTERASYRANYDIPTFEISQLNLSWQFNSLEITAGKMLTPFGRCYVPMMSNAKFDAPFIRSESVDWRQTGITAQWTPHIYDFTVGIVNGCENLDTNSMKAFIGRAGMNIGNVSFGISGLRQDGVGSEETKEFRNHFGFDAAYRFGNWTLSAEGIYDEYGNRKGILDLDDIYWEHSLYYRQLSSGEYHKPIRGFGYYLDLNYSSGKYLLDFNYGEFYPEKLNNAAYPQHDIVNRRGLVKGAYAFNKYVSIYAGLLIETAGYKAQRDRPRRGTHIFSGLQIAF